MSIGRMPSPWYGFAGCASGSSVARSMCSICTPSRKKSMQHSLHTNEKSWNCDDHSVPYSRVPGTPSPFLGAHKTEKSCGSVLVEYAAHINSSPAWYSRMSTSPSRGHAPGLPSRLPTVHHAGHELISVSILMRASYWPWRSSPLYSGRDVSELDVYCSGFMPCEQK